jgi:predicted RND superfamily exporter protein
MIRLENKHLNSKKSKEKKEGILKKSFEGYGKIVASHPYIVILFLIILTVLMFSGMARIKNQDIDFDTVLPEDLPQLKAFETIQNERGQTEEIILFIEVIPTDNSNLRDIREQVVASYTDLVSQKFMHVSYFDSISSFTEAEKDYNGDRIISSYNERRDFFDADNIATKEYFTADYSGTVVHLNLNEDVSFERGEVLRQVKEIIENTDQPEGVKVNLLGDIAVNEEMNAIMGPDSTKTALYALAGVAILLLILSRSFKYTILPLLTVVIAIFWTLGLVGFVGLPFNSITSSVLSITIGIGIDFGLQLSMRYRQDREKLEKRAAMTQTLKHTLYPMIITVVAALIGFQAMSLGNLKLMADLGNTMGISIVSSMIVAVTIVAALILVFDRKKNGMRGRMEKLKRGRRKMKRSKRRKLL